MYNTIGIAHVSINSGTDCVPSRNKKRIFINIYSITVHSTSFAAGSKDQSLPILSAFSAAPTSSTADAAVTKVATHANSILCNFWNTIRFLDYWKSSNQCCAIKFRSNLQQKNQTQISENQLKPKHNSFTAPRPRSNLARSVYGVQLPLSWQTCT